MRAWIEANGSICSWSSGVYTIEQETRGNRHRFSLYKDGKFVRFGASLAHLQEIVEKETEG